MSENRHVTIGGLREIIRLAESRGLDDDVIVIMARDEDGNSFSPLAEGTTSAVYVAESPYSGYLEHWDEDDVDDEGPDRADYEEWLAEQLDDGARPCVVLWPTN